MKNFLLVITLFTSFIQLKAQNNPDYEYSSPPKPGDPTVFKVVEQMPEYPGGEEAMMKFIQSKIQFPDDAREIGIQGRVVVRFIVEEDGGIDSISIKHSIWPSIDAEAMRVVRLLAHFKPGKQQGKGVRVQFMLPIMMKLSGGDMMPLANPDPSDDAGRRAVVAYRHENYDKALKLLKAVCEQDPANNFAAHDLGLCLYQTGDKDGACTQWKKLNDKGCHTADLLIHNYCSDVNAVRKH